MPDQKDSESGCVSNCIFVRSFAEYCWRRYHWLLEQCIKDGESSKIVSVNFSRNIRTNLQS